MTKRQYQIKHEEHTVKIGEFELPTSQPIAIYYRQSTEAQIGNISTTIQTVDMVKHMKRLGWQETDIIMIDMDGGVSGTKKIDEREGMSLLFKMITNDQLGAVACQDEDRLFRDVTQIQVNIFIEACRQHQVLVISPTMVYSFFHPHLGTHHARQFRFKSEMAAEYISSVIHGKLHVARQNVLLSGRWAGGGVPVGFMVDMRRTLANGSVNPDYKRYAIFEAYADVVRAYYHIFLSNSGCITRTVRQIRKSGPYFPEPASCPPPEGYYTYYRIRHNGDGWCPASPQTLTFILTNAAYIGHWTHKNAVVQWNNHPPIMDERTFYQAFNYLSPTMLDGTPNDNYRPFASLRRPTKEEDRVKEYPLCSGLLYFQWEDRWVPVSTHWQQHKLSYYYIAQARDGYSSSCWSKNAGHVDRIIVDLMLRRLEQTFNFDKWESAVDIYLQQYSEQKQLATTQIKQLKQVMENLVVSLSSLSTPALVAEVERKYVAAQAEYERLQQEYNEATLHANDIEQMKRFRHSFADILTNWKIMNTDERRTVIHCFLRKGHMTKVGKFSVQLDIFWRDESEDTVVIDHAPGYGVGWLPQETELLIKLMESGTDKVAIAQAFPDRTWRQIADKYRHTTKKSHKLYIEQADSIRKDETYNNYIQRVKVSSEQSMTSQEMSRHFCGPCICLSTPT